METIAERLQHLRKKAGFATATEAARAFGWKVPTYLGHENGDRNPSRETAKRYATAYKARWEWILEGSPRLDAPKDETVPIVGDVGAGARVFFSGEPQGGYDRAPRPPGSSPNTVAARVRGDSMPGVAEDDWLIYYDERVRGLPDVWIGQLCVVWVNDEQIYVKKVYRGRDGGSFLLVSTSGSAPLEVEEIEWSAKVAWIKPR
ncbi:S24 family peptidase [Methylobacterium sp. B1]|uniref:S24 family peptidase n=1 Tax=Methylobacterium sp. B1 TaxID=91459 RepID=UPI000348E88F|nr:S24 family peptidase [Methylobacterium sp. B1]